GAFDIRTGDVWPGIERQPVEGSPVRRSDEHFQLVDARALHERVIGIEGGRFLAPLRALPVESLAEPVAKRLFQRSRAGEQADGLHRAFVLFVPDERLARVVAV